MKILHIITRLIVGGAQENTLLSVVGQMQKGHEVILAAGPTTGPEGSLVPHESEIEYIEVPPLVRSVSPLKELQAYGALRKIIRQHKPDVVHTHSSKAGVVGRYAAWKERTPFVVHTIHGLPFHPYQSSLKNRLFVTAERFAAHRCHKIVCVADAMTRQALEAGIGHQDMFTTVYSGMKAESFTESAKERNAFRERYGFSNDDFVFGKVARLFELKGHRYLLPAFARVLKKNPHAKLLLVGDGLLRNHFETMAQELGISSQVVFAGLIPPEQVPGAIAATDAVVHCSLREGLARVLPQAFLSGKPVISFDVDGASEVVVNGQTGFLIPPRDIEALVSAMSQVIGNLPAAEEMAARGKELCRTRFDWKEMVEQLLTIYVDGLG